MILGDDIGERESLEFELKEFSLKLDPIVYFDEEEIETAVVHGIMCPDKFNSMILDNINHYFKYYIPKYLSVFGTSKLDSATLYMGVNDFGEITGIPFFGNLTSDYIRTFISSVIPFVKVDGDTVDNLLDGLHIDIIKLENSLDYIENSIDTIIKEYSDRKLKYETEYFSYLRKKLLWKEKLDHYLTKIVDYANKKQYRQEVVQFIIETEIKWSVTGLYDSIKILLESDDYIPVGDGTEISTRKLNKHDVVYWITEYKDIMIDRIQEERPLRMPYCNFSNNIYSNQLALLSNLRYKFIEKNKDIKYYLIKIIFPTKFNKFIYFKNSESVTWNIRTRAIVNGGPGCI